MAEKRVPQRTCIACRKEFDKKELYRIVRTKEGRFFLDKTGKADGRGAYLCKSPECYAKLAKYRLLDRTFRQSVSEEVYRTIGEGILGETK